jgi:glycosyltransferase involved in cell wall biosynthesis
MPVSGRFALPLRSPSGRGVSRLSPVARGATPDYPAELAGATADGVVCFAAVDWWYHNRGHSECQIMRRLARRMPVLWVNSIGMRLPTPGRTELTLARYARKLRSTFQGLRRDPCGLWVYSPLFVPRYSSAVVELNGWLVDRQVRWLCRRIGIHRPSAFVTLPTSCAAAERGSYVRTVFNRSDAFSEFPEVDSRLIAGLEARLLACADDVLYVSEALFQRERGRVRRAHLLDHGVDFEHFAAARGPTGPTHTAPPAISELPRPLIGFYGALDDYTIDLDLMIRVARAFPKATLLVIGPKAMEIGRLLAEPNVRYLGPLPYEELPSYAAHFDVGIMPWLRNEWIRSCNPIKLKEYLALGFPIVSTRFPQLARHAQLVHAADDPDAFVAAVGAALATPDPVAAERRRASVREASWDVLADEVGALLRLKQD